MSHSDRDEVKLCQSLFNAHFRTYKKQAFHFFWQAHATFPCFFWLQLSDQSKARGESNQKRLRCARKYIKKQHYYVTPWDWHGGILHPRNLKRTNLCSFLSVHIYLFTVEVNNALRVWLAPKMMAISIFRTCKIKRRESYSRLSPSYLQ
jgi:hypothetical protein